MNHVIQIILSLHLNHFVLLGSAIFAYELWALLLFLNLNTFWQKSIDQWFDLFIREIRQCGWSDYMTV